MQIDRLSANINTTAHATPSHKKMSKSNISLDVDKEIPESTLVEVVTKSQVNPDKVARAKELLESGDLLSFENILSTTKNIIKSGF